MVAEVEQAAADTWGHAVQFYGGDDELLHSAGGYLSEALDAGSAVIVVATAAQRMALGTRLAARDSSFAATRPRGGLLALDAAQIMSRFLINDRPDPVAFELVIGHLVREAGAAGRPVRVYSGMVALLWAAGHVSAAIQLEALWNDLGRSLSFSLFCGYPVQLVADASYPGALDEVHDLHSTVIGVPAAGGRHRFAPGPKVKAARRFAAEHGAPGDARHFVVETLRRWGDGALADDAGVVATELATNTVVHARSGFTVGVSRAEGVVRISVRDSGPVPAADGRSPMVPCAGHGLGVVAALASRWAAEPLADGKMVWAEL
jgi:MEDS: MEthanogen/methylotroph, DcmR Sensory domain